MDALHINRTALHLNDSGKYTAEDFDILTTVLSALKWREHNGSIKLITDSAGFEFYKENGLDVLWDGGMEKTLDSMPEFDEKMFWAGAKLWALKNSDAPISIIDTDFIVWAPIAFDNIPSAACIHSEDIYPDVYPPREHFKMKPGYSFDDEWDWSLRPSNTAFTVIKDADFLEYYTDEALKFMQYAEPSDDYLTYMVFAEQRLFSMCAKKCGAEILEFSNLDRLFKDGERYFTHLWGMKQQMRDMSRLRVDFCMRCITRIGRDYPEMIDVLKNIDCLRPYF